MTRLRTLTVVALTGLAASAVLPSTAGAATHRGTTPVERRDLVERENVDGTLGNDTASEVASPRAGTLTRVPTAGSVIERGQSVFDVDALPVPLLYGDIPLYRDLASGVTDGPDVQQLEENLVALGYGDALTVDQHFDGATAAALRAWQVDLSSKTAKIDSSRLCRVNGNVLSFRDWSPNGGQACSTRRSESAAPSFSR